MKVDQYFKAIVALAVAIIAALVTALGTGATDFSDIDTQTWLITAGTILGSGALVWWVKNIPGVAGGIIKGVVAGLGAAIATLVTALDDDVLSQVERLTALSAFLVALSAVYQVPGPDPEPNA
jgi:peptidoglycan/LPS O-acetylase OafA/YrhL